MKTLVLLLVLGNVPDPKLPKESVEVVAKIGQTVVVSLDNKTKSAWRVSYFNEELLHNSAEATHVGKRVFEFQVIRPGRTYIRLIREKEFDGRLEKVIIVPIYIKSEEIKS